MKDAFNTVSFHTLAYLLLHFKSNSESLSFLHKFSEMYFYLRKPDTSTRSKIGITIL